MTSAPINHRREPLRLLKQLQPFIPFHQGEWLRDRVEAIEYAEDKELAGWLRRLASATAAMPDTCSPDGFRDTAVAHLHYLSECTHWYVTAKSVVSEGIEGERAYGVSSMHPPEGQYIDLVEICRHPSVELDLDWTPTPVDKVRQDLAQWQRQWLHSTRFLESWELHEGARRRDVHVRAVRVNGKAAFRPLNNVARGLCRLLGKASLSIDDVREITHPDSLGMRVVWLPEREGDAVHELLHHSFRN